MINNMIIKIEADFMTKVGHKIKIEVITGPIIILEVGLTLEMIGIEAEEQR